MTTRFATLPIAAWLAVTIPALPQRGPIDPRPVIVQGAMQLEIEKLAGRLDNSSVERVGGWTFWRGSLDGYPVIISKTLKGMSNAAANVSHSTAMADLSAKSSLLVTVASSNTPAQSSNVSSMRVVRTRSIPPPRMRSTIT